MKKTGLFCLMLLLFLAGCRQSPDTKPEENSTEDKDITASLHSSQEALTYLVNEYGVEPGETPRILTVSMMPKLTACA